MMKQKTMGSWRYAWQMIALFVIATVAIHNTMSMLEDQMLHGDAGGLTYRALLLAIWAMLIGFMFLAGGFGLWTIRFAAESESRRRIGNLIDEMNSLKDGLVSIDRKGRLTGSNIAANSLAVVPLRKDDGIAEGFPCLTPDDMTILLDPSTPNEVERNLVKDSARHALRFRSQPAEGFSIIIISDVTAMEERARRRQQLARWQLIGRIARGVAHDFNNILCVITGHLSLLGRARPGSSESRESLDAIQHESDRGGILAGTLLNLSNWAAAGKPTEHLMEHIDRAASLLGPSLPPGWKVEVSGGGPFPLVALSGVQVEQLVLNLGLLAADSLAKPGILRVTASQPGADHLVNVGPNYAAVIVVSALNPVATDAVASEAMKMEEEEGVVQSIALSMLEGAGGFLSVLKSNDGARIYRAVLPYGNAAIGTDRTDEIPEELRAHMIGWKVLSAGSTRHHQNVDVPLSDIGMQVESLQDIVAVLARVESGQQLDMFLIEKNLLGQHAEGLLKAIVKLCPRSGLVVFCEDPAAEARRGMPSVVYTPTMSAPARIYKAILEARALAERYAGEGAARAG